MNKVIRQLGFGLFALYLILFGALIYWQVVSTERLSSEEGNNRAILRQYERPRGIIVTSDGISLRAPAEQPGAAAAGARPTSALVMEATARTYRYLDPAEIAAQQKARQAAQRGRK